MADPDRVLDSKRGVITHFRGLRRGAGGPHCVIKGFRRDHRARHAVLLERAADTAHDSLLLVLAQRFGGDHVRIVRGPVADSDFGVLLDDALEADWLASGSVE